MLSSVTFLSKFVTIRKLNSYSKPENLDSWNVVEVSVKILVACHFQRMPSASWTEGCHSLYRMPGVFLLIFQSVFERKEAWKQQLEDWIVENAIVSQRGRFLNFFFFYFWSLLNFLSGVTYLSFRHVCSVKQLWGFISGWIKVNK